jgi:hypothetical protein
MDWEPAVPFECVLSMFSKPASRLYLLKFPSPHNSSTLGISLLRHSPLGDIQNPKHNILSLYPNAHECFTKHELQNSKFLTVPSNEISIYL